MQECRSCKCQRCIALSSCIAYSSWGACAKRCVHLGLHWGTLRFGLGSCREVIQAFGSLLRDCDVAAVEGIRSPGIVQVNICSTNAT